MAGTFSRSAPTIDPPPLDSPPPPPPPRLPSLNNRRSLWSPRVRSATTAIVGSLQHSTALKPHPEGISTPAQGWTDAAAPCTAPPTCGPCPVAVPCRKAPPHMTRLFMTLRRVCVCVRVCVRVSMSDTGRGRDASSSGQCHEEACHVGRRLSAGHMCACLCLSVGFCPNQRHLGLLRPRRSVL